MRLHIVRSSDDVSEIVFTYDSEYKRIGTICAYSYTQSIHESVEHTEE